VLRLQCERTKDQQVKRALRKFNPLVCHWREGSQGSPVTSTRDNTPILVEAQGERVVCYEELFVIRDGLPKSSFARSA
jgi:hypothetical protein